MVAGIKEKAGVHEDAKSTAHRTVGQSVKQSWDCSKIENEEEEEEENWQYKGIIDGLCRGERKCIDLNAGDADVWIGIWEELHFLVSKEVSVEVEHVKAHRKERDKKEMSHHERFVTEGNEKADELAKDAAMWDEGFVAQARTGTIQQEREEVYAALQYAASFHCLVEEWKDCEELVPQPKEQWIFVDRRGEETKHRTEWCAQAKKHRCIRCERSSKHMKMQGKCGGPKYLSKNLGRWRKRHMGGHDLVRRMDRESF